MRLSEVLDVEGAVCVLWDRSITALTQQEGDEGRDIEDEASPSVGKVAPQIMEKSCQARIAQFVGSPAGHKRVP